MARGPVALTPRERLIFALDAPSGADALAWVDRLGDAVQFYKIGMELLASGDYFSVLDELARRDKRVFVDLKFFDIPATVAGVPEVLSSRSWASRRKTQSIWAPAAQFL